MTGKRAVEDKNIGPLVKTIIRLQYTTFSKTFSKIFYFRREISQNKLIARTISHRTKYTELRDSMNVILSETV